MKMLLALIVLASFAEAQQSWQVSTSRNALTDVSTTIAITHATDYVGDKDKAPDLVARLSGKTCDLYVNVPYTLLGDYVRVRYDKGKIESPGSSLAEDQGAVFIAHQFGKIKTASTVVVEYAPYQLTHHAVTFDVRGLPAQFDSCIVSERKNAIEEKAAATRRAAAARKAAAEDDNVMFEERAAAEQRAAAEAKAAAEQSEADAKSSELAKRKELCELPSFAKDPKFCTGVGVPVQK